MAEICNNKDEEASGDKVETRPASEEELSNIQKARIERNRQRALLLRQSRLANHPYYKSEHHTIQVGGTKLIDTGGGFFLEEMEKIETTLPTKVIQKPAAIIANKPICTECQKEFAESFLLSSYDESICDECRNPDERHALITKTEAKELYLLKDCDLDKREPPLKYILRKNPHNPNWGQMNLYLRSQVEARALEIWKTLEKLEEEKLNRSGKREKLRQKRYNKKIQELRKAVRSSLWKKESSYHEHEYGPEMYNETDDIYYKNCTLCNHTVSYEKM